MINPTFEDRRKKLAGLSDAGLRARFWRLAEQVVAPLAEPARTHSRPLIDWSVLVHGSGELALL